MVSIRERARRLIKVNDGGRRIGEDHHRAKLSDADVELVLRLHEGGLGYARIAQKFDDIPGGVAKSTIRDICTAQTRAQLCARIKRLPVDPAGGELVPAQLKKPPLTVKLTKTPGKFGELLDGRSRGLDRRPLATLAEIAQALGTTHGSLRMHLAKPSAPAAKVDGYEKGYRARVKWYDPEEVRQWWCAQVGRCG